MPEHSLDHATDEFVCAILQINKPSQELEPFVTSIGYDIPSIEVRRALAHKLIQKYLNQFKASEAKPITKFRLLQYGIAPYICDYILEPLNKHCVAYGITTNKRINTFIELCSEFSNKFTKPNPLYLPITEQGTHDKTANVDKQIEETCKLWHDLKCNYFVDKNAITQLRERLFRN